MTGARLCCPFVYLHLLSFKSHALQDGRSFLHVNYYATARASWQSVGLLLASSLAEARATSKLQNSSLAAAEAAAAAALDAAVSSVPQEQLALQLQPSDYNYVLAALNATLVHHMQELGVVASSVACLIYVDSNVTLSKPVPVPPVGVLVARPLTLVGLVTANTSVDFHMAVNSILLTSTWSNITLDRLVIENLAPGNARSAEIAAPLSVSSPVDFW